MTSRKKPVAAPKRARRRSTKAPPRIRRQVYELTLADFATAPAWEFALDEVEIDRQDEATVRPHAFAKRVDPAAGMLVVRARFRLADGTEHLGYLTPSASADTDLGLLQPIVLADAGQVAFWCGCQKPTRAERHELYQRLGKKPSQVFPVHFTSDVPLRGGAVEGEIPGFLVLESGDSGRIHVLK